MSERRRRRLEEESGGGLPLFPLVLVVILAGLLMGGLLAHFLGGSKSVTRSAPTAVAVVPSPAATPAPIPTSPRPQATPVPSPSATPTLRPTASPAATASQAPTPTRSRKSVTVVAAVPARVRPTPQPPSPPTPSRTPTPKVVATVAASRAKPPAGPADDRASALVRSYLQALARGDRSGAASYLASGAPNETFMTPESHIESIRSSSVGPQQYRVTADVQTASGEYYVTFTVEQSPGGLAITDHYSIKPQ